MRRILFLSTIFFLTATTIQAQYFGRNKPRYQQQEFKVTQTPHFEIYEYLKNPEKKQELVDAAELWYQMHSSVLDDTFSRLNPMIIYNDHVGFQQTNAIQGQINVGTGGVTEGLRNRVVFPVAVTNQQTHHVLGHELVHAFQYHMIFEGDSTSMQNLANLPLWMVEGLAEYLSIGRIDPHTALWMRDAVLHDNLPKNLRALDSGKYFPYRWGQAFWAYVTGVYGDEAIKPLFINTAKYGLEPAIYGTLGIKSDQLAKDWTESLRQTYGNQMKGITAAGNPLDKSKKDKKDENPFGLTEKAPGKPILTDKNAGGMNISPVLSPNGKYVIFLSEKDLFSIDMYLADAKTGEIIRKVVSTTKDGHIDQLNAMESGVTWSPDSKKFAFDAYQQGASVLIIKDIVKKKTEKRSLKGVPSFSNPAWSPDGRTIVVVGQVNGQTDLFAYDVKTKKVRRLTNDRNSEILPAWNTDGTKLAYATDQLSLQRGRTNGAWKMNLAVMDIASGATEIIDVFPNADNVNPQFDEKGNLIFLSDRDGFRNMYKYETATKKVYQMTDLLTGITGITPYAPAISVADSRDRIVYTYYSDGEYAIFQGKTADFELREVDATKVDMTPAALPPFAPGRRDMVNTNLRLMNLHDSDSVKTDMKSVKYKPKFTLEYLGGGAGAGVMTGNTSFGNNVGVAGGVNMLFGDVLGNNQIFAGLALNGQIEDIAAQASYINNKKRIGWGVTASHYPFSTYGGYSAPRLRDVEINPGDTVQLLEEGVLINRLFNQRVGGLAFYPFSTTTRFEISGAFDFYQQRSTAYYTYYAPVYPYQVVGSDRKKEPRGPSFRMASVGTALVGDNSYFGGTAPLQGWRYRIGAEQYLGYWNFTTALLDGRYYHRIKPLTFAIRGLAYGRMGGNANNINEVYPLFVAQPWFVRGYGNRLFDQQPDLFQRIAGSKLGVANFEIRLPFTGPRGLALIPARGFLTDLNLFFDAGVAWFESDDLKPQNGTNLQHKPIASTGVSLRINLLGALIIEPYFALPLSVDKSLRQWGWGLNIQPGW